MPSTAVSTDLVLAHLDSLPTLPAIALRVLELTGDHDASVDQLARVLRGDQSLVARILRAVGAASRGVREHVTTIERAIPLLGLRGVRNIVLAVNLFERFGPASPDDAESETFDRAEFWKHSIAVACVARRLALAAQRAGLDPEDAYLAGLLHDLGKVALDAVFPKAFHRAVAMAEQSRGDLADYEREVLGVDHTVAGRRLAERWRLPQPLADVIWLHHLAPDTLPSRVANPHLIGLIQVADTISREHGLGHSGNFAFYDHSPGLAARIGLADADLAAATAALASDVAEQAELLGLVQPQGADACNAVLQQANTELARNNVELAEENRRLAAALRYATAAATFERDLANWTDPPAVALAGALAMRSALPKATVAVWHVRPQGAVLDVALFTGAEARPRIGTTRPPPALLDWLESEAGGTSGALVPAPPALLHAVFEHGAPSAGGVAMHMRFAAPQSAGGGLVLITPAGSETQLADEQSGLCVIADAIAAAFRRADDQAATQRLSEDLAETNRRLQQTQTELLRSRSLAMIAEMAAGAGHELNGPLAVISGRAQMLARACDDPEMHRVLKTISDKAHECSGIVTELMTFAKPRPATRTPVELHALAASARENWLRESGLPPSAIRIEPSAAGAGPATVLGDAAQLEIVLRELLSNATDAIAPEGGLITLRVQPRNDDTVELSVRDNGYGMPTSVLQRAFDPFYSHRNAGRRRGLGLPRAYRIVEAHGGRIWLESRTDEGTTARVRLPIAR